MPTDYSQFFIPQEQQQTLASPAPTPTTPATTTPDDEISIGGEIAGAIFGGAGGAVQETLDFGFDVADAVFDFEAEENPLQLPDIIPENQTTIGQAARGIVQFGLGMVGAGKFIQPLRIAQRFGTWTKAGKVTQAATAGAIADAVVIDPMEGRLSNLIEQVPALQNPVTEALAADPDDTVWEGRLKNVAEGAGLGIAADVLVSGVRFLKGYREAKKSGPKAAAKFARENIEEVEKTVRPTVNDEDALKAALGEPLEEGAPRAFNEEKLSEHIEAADMTERLWRESAEEVKAKTEPQKLKDIEDDARLLADTYDISPEEMTAILSAQAKSTDEYATRLVAAKKYLDNESTTLVELAERVRMGDTAAEPELVRRAGFLADNAARVKQMQTEAARATAAGRINVGTIPRGLKQADAKKLAEFITSAEGNPKAIMRLSKTTRALEVANEYWINSLLSGPKTHLVNMVSNTVNALLMPIERGLGSAWQGDIAGVKEAVYHFAGLQRTMWDSLKMAKKAFVQEANILDPTSMINDVSNAKALTGEGPVGWMGAMMRLPSRFLLAEDEWFKQMTYRSTVYSRAMRQASENGLRGADAAKYADDALDKAFNEMGGAVDELGQQFAREATFTQELGDFGQRIQGLTRNYPALRFVLPFVRTPSNIIKQAWFRTPGLNMLSKEFKGALRSDDPAVRALAQGRMATGMAITSTAVGLALSGKITGFGPDDPGLRQRMYDAGWRPYSLKIGDTYVDLRRLEPFSIPFGAIADATELVNGMDDKDAEEIAYAFATAFARNVTSKTYLQGIVDLANAASDPQRYGPRFFQNMASGFVPYSAGLQQGAAIAGKDDPYFREINSMLDAIKAKVPGWSETLPARVNWMTGEPVPYPESQFVPSRITPIPVVKDQSAPVADWLVEIGFDMDKPLNQIKGVELTDRQYERFMELHGQIKLRGRRGPENLMQAITRNLAEAREQGQSLEYQRQVATRLAKVYRDAAREEMIHTDQGLEQEILTKMRDEALALIGGTQ